MVRGALKSILTVDSPRVIIRGWRRAPTVFMQRIRSRRDMTASHPFGSRALRKIDECKSSPSLITLVAKCGVRFAKRRKPSRIGDEVRVSLDFVNARAQTESDRHGIQISGELHGS